MAGQGAASLGPYALRGIKRGATGGVGRGGWRVIGVGGVGGCWVVTLAGSSAARSRLPMPIGLGQCFSFTLTPRQVLGSAMRFRKVSVHHRLRSFFIGFESLSSASVIPACGNALTPVNNERCNNGFAIACVAQSRQRAVRESCSTAVCMVGRYSYGINQATISSCGSCLMYACSRWQSNDHQFLVRKLAKQDLVASSCMQICQCQGIP